MEMTAEVTPRIFEALTECGFEPAKARRIGRAIIDDVAIDQDKAVKQLLGQVMTKEDGRRLDQRIDQLDQRIDRIDQRIDRIDQRIDRIDQRLDQRFDLLGDKVDRQLYWLVGTMIGSMIGVAGIILAGIKLLH